MDPSIEAVLDHDDYLLDSRVWKVVLGKRKDGTIQKYYLNMFTSATVEFVPPDQKRTFTDEEVAELTRRWKKNISANRGKLFGSGFARLPKSRSNEDQITSNENQEISANTMVVIQEEEDVMEIEPPPQEEEEEDTIDAIRDTFSRKYFERTVGKTKQFIVDRCAELGIPIVYTAGPKQGKPMTVDAIWIVVDKIYTQNKECSILIRIVSKPMSNT